MWDVDSLQKTWNLVCQLHFGQKYGSAVVGQEVEYINHIASVVFEVLALNQVENDFDLEFALKCAMLHDTIEDTNLIYEDVIRIFGLPVANGVKALTKNEEIGDKKEMMIDCLNRIKKQPKEVAIVKMADRICNLQVPPHYWNNNKKQNYVEEAKLILDELFGYSQHLSFRLSSKINNYNSFLTR